MITSAIVGAVVSLLLLILAPPILRLAGRGCHWAADGLRPRRAGSRTRTARNGR